MIGIELTVILTAVGTLAEKKPWKYEDIDLQLGAWHTEKRIIAQELSPEDWNVLCLAVYAIEGFRNVTSVLQSEYIVSDYFVTKFKSIEKNILA